MVIGIISLFTLFAYPNFRASQIKTHRIEAKIALLDLANRLEQFYTEHQTYETAKIASNTPFDVLNNATTANHWYVLSITKATESFYLLKATPFGPQANEDRECQSFTYDSNGEKGLTSGTMGNPTGNISQCWSE